MVLEVNDLCKSFRTGFFSRKVEVLKNVSFSVQEGSVVGFIGANGAGKSTTIKSILGLIQPDSGNITYFDKEKISPKLFKKIGFLPERPNFYNFLSGKEFLLYYGQLSNNLFGKVLNERVDRVLKKVHLYGDKDKKIKSYSKGMIQRIGIAQALVHDPKFIVLDEPLSGLDPDGRYQLSQIIKNAAREGKTIFFSSHLLDDTEKLCDKILVIENGMITFSDEISKILGGTQVSFVINYVDKGQKKSVKVIGENELNNKIHQLVSKKIIISDIHKKQKSLEEAYVSLQGES